MVPAASVAVTAIFIELLLSTLQIVDEQVPAPVVQAPETEGGIPVDGETVKVAP